VLPDIVEFWNRCPLDHPPFVHPEDKRLVRRCAPELLRRPISSYEGFVRSKRFGDFDDHGFHFSLLPAPYAGDLIRAKIFLLMLNPGFKMADYCAEFQMPIFRQRAIANLKQRSKAADFPFLFLDPELSWHTGFLYFERKLRLIAQALARQSRKPYLEALRQLARSIAVLQMVPYHSASLKANWAFKLPSAEKAREFAHEYVFPRAAAGEALAVILRNGKRWGAPARCRNIVSYKGPHARGASLGPETRGGEAILRFFGLR